MILLVDLYEKKDPLRQMEFVRPVEKILNSQGVPFLTKHFSEILDDDIDNVDGIILCGTPLGDTKYFTHADDLKWILKTQRPVFGICGGMQTILKMSGGTESKCKEIGKIKLQVIVEDDILDGVGLDSVYSLHSVMVSVPEDFIEIAKSDLCPHLVKHKTKRIYGALFHPEVLNPKLIVNFVKSL